LFLLGAALHEGGHLIAMRLVGLDFALFSLSPLGAEIQTADPYCPYTKELAVFLAGPLANAASAAIALLFLRRHFTEPLLFFFATSVFLMLFHLFPCTDSDGYKALYSLLCLLWKPWRAEELMRALGQGCSAILLIAGILLFLTNGNFTLLVFAASGCGFLFPSRGKKKKATMNS